MTKRDERTGKRNLFREVSSGVRAMRDHLEGRLELRSHKVELPMAYQLKVMLMESDPPIWRRLRLPDNTTLPRLDRIIETAMGWTNSHLHTFTAGGVIYAVPDPEWGIDVKDERRVRLDRIAKEEGEAFVYVYDMGDSWQHQVLVEKVGADSSDGKGAVCLAGERACPPEDCGGMTGGSFDPDAFNVKAVNAVAQSAPVTPRRSSRICAARCNGLSAVSVRCAPSAHASGANPRKNTPPSPRQGRGS